QPPSVYLHMLLCRPMLAFDIGQSTRCVAIPSQFTMCKDVGYSEMRLPNFLGHSDLEAEVVPYSQEWKPLLLTGCHLQAQAFLCSLMAPVCLDNFIWPCRSLCIAVRDSCASALSCQGRQWPEVLDCDRFPDEDDMCLSPHSRFTHIPKDLPKPACQNCPSVDGDPPLRVVLHSFCLYDFALTLHLHRPRQIGREPELEIRGRVQFIHQGPLMAYDSRHLLQQWLLINLKCARSLVRLGRSQLYVMTGSVLPDGTMALTRLFPWHKKDANIAVAIRKWQYHRC
uniref:Secreted frizzled-related protein 5-like n=1 Tax=Gouania willdenowi TaxID=441366 RepID=A0A8C5DFC5_GOUWI